MASNNTTTPYYPLEMSVFVLQSIILIIGISGNLLVISAIVSDRRLRSSLNYLVLNLSVCNICAVVFSIPFQLTVMRYNNDFVFGDIGCKILYPCSTWAFNVSVSLLLTITIDRYIVIVHPFFWRSVRHHTLKIIAANYLYGIATVVPYACNIEISYDDNGLRYCQETWSLGVSRFYTVFLFFLQCVIPVSAMIVLYTLAWFNLKRTNELTIRLSEAARKAQTMSLRQQQDSDDAFDSGGSGSSDYTGALLRRPRHPSIVSTYSDEAKMMCLAFCCPIGCRPWSRCRRKKQQRSTTTRTLLSSPQTEPSAAVDHYVANGRRRQTIRTFFMFLLIITIFTVSSLPSQLNWIFASFSKINLPASLVHAFVLLHYVNFVTNPFIYGGLNKYFLRAYKRLFLCSSPSDVRGSSIYSNGSTKKKSLTAADSTSPNDRWSSCLFKEGIITQNPVIVISAGGSLDSIWEDEEEEGDKPVEEGSLPNGKMDSCNHLHAPSSTFSASIMKKKQVKFKLSSNSNPFRKLSPMTTTTHEVSTSSNNGIQDKRKTSNPLSRKLSSVMLQRVSFRKISNPLFRKISQSSSPSSAYEKQERKHRKISAALVENRQRKLTLPVLAASTGICDQDKNRIRKYSMPVATGTLNGFVFNDNFALLPPTKPKSSSIRKRLLLPFFNNNNSPSPISSNLTVGKLNNNLVASSAESDLSQNSTTTATRLRKTGFFAKPQEGESYSTTARSSGSTQMTQHFFESTPLRQSTSFTPDAVDGDLLCGSTLPASIPSCIATTNNSVVSLDEFVEEKELEKTTNSNSSALTQMTNLEFCHPTVLADCVPSKNTVLIDFFSGENNKNTKDENMLIYVDGDSTDSLYGTKCLRNDFLKIDTIDSSHRGLSNNNNPDGFPIYHYTDNSNEKFDRVSFHDSEDSSAKKSPDFSNNSDKDTFFSIVIPNNNSPIYHHHFPDSDEKLGRMLEEIEKFNESSCLRPESDAQTKLCQLLSQLEHRSLVTSLPRAHSGVNRAVTQSDLENVENIDGKRRENVFDVFFVDFQELDASPESYI